MGRYRFWRSEKRAVRFAEKKRLNPERAVKCDGMGFYVDWVPRERRG